MTIRFLQWCPAQLGVVLFAALLPGLVSASVYPLPADGGNIIGQVQHAIARHEDTLFDIARRHGVGFNEIVSANPGVDPWIPGEGATVIIPTRFILPSKHRSGIVINLAEMRLYYFPRGESANRQVITHPVGIGSEEQVTPLGSYRITSKVVGPSWRMPDSLFAELLAQGEKPRRFVPPGPDNPLGAFAMALDVDGYYIHGTHQPYSIGMRSSRGCIRMYPEDIEFLFSRVPSNTQVHIIDEPYKIGQERGVLYLETHVAADADPESQPSIAQTMRQLAKRYKIRLSDGAWQRLWDGLNRRTGIPLPVASIKPAESAKDIYLKVGAFNNEGLAFDFMERMRLMALPALIGDQDSDEPMAVWVGPFPTTEMVYPYAAFIRYAFGLEGVMRQAAPPPRGL